MALRFPIIACLLLVSLAGCDAARTDATSGSVASASPAAAAEPVAFDDDFSLATERARREGKPLLILFETSWCPYCRRLRAEIFTRAEFRAVAERFVCVRVDGDRDEKRCAEYGVRAFPTLVPAAADGTALERIVGVPSVEAIVSRMNTAAATIVAVRPESPQEPTRR